MKKLLFIFMLLPAFALVGCNDKNSGTDDTGGNKGPVYGEDFVETVSDLDMKMIYVEGGTFSMGATAEQEDDAYDWEYPVREVTLAPFYIAECEVTQSQWEKVMYTTIESQAYMAGKSVYYGVGADYPMYYVSWEEAQAFCEMLSELTGKNYCLPTEAQWEYAARGGNKSRGYKYSGSDDIEEVAWYMDNSETKNSASRVKTKQPNELGLYDMSGNVYEWCRDRYGNYDADDTDNPAGPDSGFNRVLRGGSWDVNARSCRVSYRYYDYPDDRYYRCGFRVAVIP